MLVVGCVAGRCCARGACMCVCMHVNYACSYMYVCVCMYACSRDICNVDHAHIHTSYIHTYMCSGSDLERLKYMHCDGFIHAYIHHTYIHTYIRVQWLRFGTFEIYALRWLQLESMRAIRKVSAARCIQVCMCMCVSACVCVCMKVCVQSGKAVLQDAYRYVCVCVFLHLCVYV